MKGDALLGIHAVRVSSPDPPAAARLFRELLGLPARRDGAALVVGDGPELTVRLERGPAGPAVEISVAVKELPAGLDGRPDALGGDSAAREAGGVRLVLRVFRRPPAVTFRRR